MPTFGRDRTEPLLLEAVLAIGSWLDGASCHRDMSASLARKITGKLLGETDAPPSLALLQALLLLVIHFTTCTVSQMAILGFLGSELTVSNSRATRRLHVCYNFIIYWCCLFAE